MATSSILLVGCVQIAPTPSYPQGRGASRFGVGKTYCSDLEQTADERSGQFASAAAVSLAGSALTTTAGVLTIVGDATSEPNASAAGIGSGVGMLAVGATLAVAAGFFVSSSSDAAELSAGATRSLHKKGENNGTATASSDEEAFAGCAEARARWASNSKKTGTGNGGQPDKK